MNTQPNDPATGFAIPGDESRGWAPESVTGLTKREYFAAMAMQGLIDNDVNPAYYINRAEEAVQMADALITALNENQND
jgi:hypothetical protein